jgi:cerevisin
MIAPHPVWDHAITCLFGKQTNTAIKAGFPTANLILMFKLAALVSAFVGAIALPQVQLNQEYIPNEFVVIFKDDAALNSDQFVSALFTNDVMQEASLLHEYDFGFAAKMNDAALEYVRALQEVDFVEENKIFSIYKAQENSPSWGLPRISQRKFEDKTKYNFPESAGEGVDVYVIDTGVNTKHNDFEGRAVFGFNAVSREAASDFNGHGTHVASTVAGAKYGVAKKANIIAVKVLDGRGSGTLADVIAGIDYAAKNAQKTGKRSAANMSLGGGRSQALDQAVDRAVKSGLSFAVAAGNSYADACYYSPAASTFGATANNDVLAYFSNHGKCVDIQAPGHGITGAWIGSSTATKTISGTSMASPHVAGVMALLLSEKDYTPAELKVKMVEIATKDAIKNLPANTVNALLFNNFQASFENDLFF